MEADTQDQFMREMRLCAEARMNAAREFLQQQPLVGLPAVEAQRLARAAGIAFRDVDVAQPIFSADLQPGRVTAMVEHGVVVSAEVGN